ncbi:hypothetical protein [Fischerella sp. PCC 9605]|uniref:hypothetical protein n=1 Tax=Fischerella sp. PCC 9605 TaxID=1173024 RepID=UPI00047B3B77|nr:hypothetical protein [Fischerella sp. PCC 9605]
MESSKELFDYWYNRVQLKNYPLIESSEHVKTHELRHECTNYDDLRQSNEVQVLEEPERSKVIAIIKYECTARVLQERARILRERAKQYEDDCNQLNQERSRLAKLIKLLQEKLFGKDKEIKKLEAQVAALQARNEALQSEVEKSKAYSDLLQEFEKLKKQYEQVQKRRQELAKNNQSLGGRVAHTQRFRRERDEARVIIEDQKYQIKNLIQENTRLREELSKYINA